MAMIQKCLQDDDGKRHAQKLINARHILGGRAIVLAEYVYSHGVSKHTIILLNIGEATASPCPLVSTSETVIVASTSLQKIKSYT